MRRLFDEASAFLGNEINRVLVFLTIILVVIISLSIILFSKLESIQNAVIINNSDIKKVEKKVDFRYFNLTNSLEDVFSIDIDTKTGNIKK